jgi:hypothetical protein
LFGRGSKEDIVKKININEIGTNGSPQGNPKEMERKEGIFLHFNVNL